MFISDFWMGSEASLRYVLDAYEQALSNPANYPPRVDAGGLESDDPADSLITIQDGIGILTVTGPMVSKETWVNDLFGIVSYPQIGRAVAKLVEKYEAGEIHSVIHVWNTTGGDASGIEQLSETLKIASQRAPDTVSWTGESALSAGYWLATVNPSLRMDKMAQVGSIGVVATAISVAKQLEKEGVEAKVVRAGENKALLHPFEPLSEKGLKEMQAKADQYHQFFLEHVVSRRPGLSLGNKDEWGTGKTFFAQEAIALGLADGPPIGLSSLANFLVSRHNAGNGQRKYTFGGGTDMTQKVLFPNEEVRAQVASGVDLSHVPHQIVDEPVEEDEGGEDEVRAEAKEPVAAPVQAAQDDLTVIGFLRTELREAQAQIVALAAEKEGLMAKVNQLSATESTLAPIVVEAIQRLQVGLGQTPMSLDGLPAATLAEQYAKTREAFERRYPAGRRSLAEGTADRKPVDIAEARLSLIK